MDIIETLQQEHREALRRLDLLETALKGIAEVQGESPPASVAPFVAQWGWFRVDLTLHFRKEEEALFPEAAGVLSAEEGPIAQMRAEHVEFEGLRSEVVGALETLQTGCCGHREAEARLRRAGAQLCALLREHIWKEDNVLFPLLREVLPPERLAAATRRAERMEAAAGPPAPRASREVTRRAR